MQYKTIPSIHIPSVNIQNSVDPVQLSKFKTVFARIEKVLSEGVQH